MSGSSLLERRNSKTRAYWAVVGSVLGFAFVPLTIELTATGSNPFYFNAFATVSQTATLLIFLQFFARRTFHGCRHMKDPVTSLVRGTASVTAGKRVRWSRTWKTFFVEGSRTYDPPSVGTSATVFRRAMFRFGWVGLPLVWLSLSRLEYAFFAWSAGHVDSAVTASLFRLWPLLMVFVLAKYGTFLRTRKMSGDAANYRISKRKSLLMSLTLVGATFVVLSQSEGSALSVFTDAGAAAGGVALALAGAFFAGISPACSLIFGDQMHRMHSKTKSVRGAERSEESLWVQAPVGTQPLQRENEGLQRMWFAVLGHAVSGVAVVPLNLVLGFVTRGYPSGLSSRAILGGLLVGAFLSGLGVLLLRVANTLTSDLGVNSVFYVMPLLSLLLLSVTGIDIPRMDLFIVGTTLILALTILIESDPDETSDPESLNKTQYVTSR